MGDEKEGDAGIHRPGSGYVNAPTVLFSGDGGCCSLPKRGDNLRLIAGEDLESGDLVRVDSQGRAFKFEQEGKPTEAEVFKAIRALIDWENRNTREILEMLRGKDPHEMTVEVETPTGHACRCPWEVVRDRGCQCGGT